MKRGDSSGGQHKEIEKVRGFLGEKQKDSRSQMVQKMRVLVVLEGGGGGGGHRYGMEGRRKGNGHFYLHKKAGPHLEGGRSDF